MTTPTSPAPMIGCIADDFTGATDLAGLLARSGMRVVQCFGVPRDDRWQSDHHAIVVATKTRSVPAAEAVGESIRAAEWLESRGVSRFFFKYCSTFDSTDRGNIGPVAEGLMQHLETEQAIFCPAFPENGRTVYRGHLFVGDQLLHESGMQNHPLNPMTDANLVRVLAAQSRQSVSLLNVDVIERGPEAIRAAINHLDPLIVTDAIDNRQLKSLAQAVADDRLVTGGSALGGCIAEVLWDRTTCRQADDDDEAWIRGGPAAVLAGSCSLATQRQVKTFGERNAWLCLDVVSAANGPSVLENAKRWIDDRSDGDTPIMISTTTDASSLAAIQEQIGRQRAAEVAEAMLSELGEHLIGQGIRRLVVAGGETSGAVVNRLGIEAIRIGKEIVPGVPWTQSLGDKPVALALKSGNFGGDNFFQQALDLTA